MNINPLQFPNPGRNSFTHSPNAKVSSSKLVEEKTDRVEIKADLSSKLEDIKKKVKNGFYNKNEVIDDITEHLTQVFIKDANSQ